MGNCGIIRGCRVKTAGDCREWHAGGRAGEDDGDKAWRRWDQLERRVRTLSEVAYLVGKGGKPSAVVGWDS